MQFKVTPVVDVRYWFAMAIASMCGANLGDIFMDILKLGIGPSLISLAVLFALLLVVERTTSAKTELIYWAAILIIRAGATNIADFSVQVAHLTYLETGVVLALILVSSVALNRGLEPKMRTGALPPTGAHAWFTMLIAGTLGTVIADGLGHAFGPVQTGVPVSALIATVVVIAAMAVRYRREVTGIANYWMALVAIRWWGTNVGDICAYILTLLASTAATAAALSALLLVWRTRRPSALERARG